MKKYIIIFISFFLFKNFYLHAEFNSILNLINITKKTGLGNVWNSNGLVDFYCINDKIFITAGSMLIEKDLNSVKLTQYTHFSTDKELNLSYFLSGISNSTDIIPKDIWIYGMDRFTKLSDLTTNPSITDVILTKDINEIFRNDAEQNLDKIDCLNGAVMVKTQEELNNNIYIITYNKLLKIDLDKPDSLLLEVLYSTAVYDNEFNQGGSAHRNLVYNFQDSLLWFTNYFRDKIGQYNTNTKVMTVFNYNNLPVNKGFRIYNYCVMPDPY